MPHTDAPYEDALDSLREVSRSLRCLASESHAAPVARDLAILAGCVVALTASFELLRPVPLHTRLARWIMGPRPVHAPNESDV